MQDTHKLYGRDPLSCSASHSWLDLKTLSSQSLPPQDGSSPPPLCFGCCLKPNVGGGGWGSR